MNLHAILDREILPNIEKPSRYLGNEVNSVHKDVSKVRVRIALAFPDLYDVGLGNLGLHILYAILNKEDDVWCERAYAPAGDMEAILRERDLPLFALESKDSLESFEGIGFTLQSELTFTNILNMIDLARIPLRTRDRGDHHPLTFAGGPAVFNPEPLAPFMDFFVIGDGEEAVTEIASLFRRLKGQPRSVKLAELAQIPGIYVPSLYPFETTEDGRVLPKQDAPKIVKRITKDLDKASFPIENIVPFTKQVHDRLSLEVLRGCTQGCRFCQAGMTTRPVRERSLGNLDKLMEQSLNSTGYEEVSLVSLSTCDYSQVRALVEQAVERAKPQRVAVTLPSLRLDSFSIELSEMVAEERKSGITFAPEAASPRLRSVINKWIPDEELLSMSGAVYDRGWDLVKLYFMIGLPTERDDDVEAIADLAIRTWKQGKEKNNRAKLNMGVSTFVPKPFTPFQWAAQIGTEETNQKQRLLREKLWNFKSIKLGRHDPKETFIEGMITRSDRRAADLLELAFKKGCRFDAWREQLRFDLWLEAIEELEFDIEDALRERHVDERLPWDHIDVMIPKQWLKDDWQRAKELQYAQDCRHKKCNKCGVIDVERELCASMMRKSIAGRKPEREWVRSGNPERVNLPGVFRLWIRIGRLGNARFLSHLEALNVWVRALRRVKTPLAYSQGFHPHPKIAFSSATPSGEETVGDYMDLILTEVVELPTFLAGLRDTLPEGFEVFGAIQADLKAPSLMASVSGAQYVIAMPQASADQLQARMDELMAMDEIIVQRKAKQKGHRKRVLKPVNVRPMLAAMELTQSDVPSILFRFEHVDGKGAKAKEVLSLFGELGEGARVIKRDTRFDTLPIGLDQESIGIAAPTKESLSRMM